MIVDLTEGEVLAGLALVRVVQSASLKAGTLVLGADDLTSLERKLTAAFDELGRRGGDVEFPGRER